MRAGGNYHYSIIQANCFPGTLALAIPTKTTTQLPQFQEIQVWLLVVPRKLAAS